MEYFLYTLITIGGLWSIIIVGFFIIALVVILAGVAKTLWPFIQIIGIIIWGILLFAAVGAFLGFLIDWQLSTYYEFTIGGAIIGATLSFPFLINAIKEDLRTFN
jgi:hypothetical protein